MNIVIIIAIIIQVLIAKSSRMAGAIFGFVLTTGIFLWGIIVYASGGYVTFFNIRLPQFIFWIACLGWYAGNINELLNARKEQKAIVDTKESH